MVESNQTAIGKLAQSDQAIQINWFVSGKMYKFCLGVGKDNM